MDTFEIVASFYIGGIFVVYPINMWITWWDYFSGIFDRFGFSMFVAAFWPVLFPMILTAEITSRPTYRFDEYGPVDNNF